MNENQGSLINGSQNYNNKCNTSSSQLNIERYSEERTVRPSDQMNDSCNPYNFKNVTITDSKYLSLPLVNRGTDECFCEKYYYEPFEEASCICQATNETCSIFEPVPGLVITEMRRNPYYISVSIKHQI